MPYRTTLLTLVVLAGLAIGATSSSAFTPPELFVKEIVTDPASGKPQDTGAWVPLGGARLTSLNDRRIGVLLQESPASGNAQRLLLVLHGVPDGSPSQDLLHGTLCFRVSGAAGTIVPSEEYVSFEGAGPYALSATLTTGSDIGNGCQNGPTGETAFTWTPAPTTVAFFGRPLISYDPIGIGRGGVVVTKPRGALGTPEVLCARNPVRRADGSLTGSPVSREVGDRIKIDDLVKRAGRWGCVARVEKAGIKLPWSAPATTVVRSTFNPHAGQTVLRDAIGPTYRITHQFDRSAAGLRYTLTLTRAARPNLVRTGRLVFRGRLDRRGRLDVRFGLPAPPRPGVYISYLASLGVAATPLITALPALPFVNMKVRTDGGRTAMRFEAP